jgi:hypothetical protein
LHEFLSLGHEIEPPIFSKPLCIHHLLNTPFLQTFHAYVEDAQDSSTGQSSQPGACMPKRRWELDSAQRRRADASFKKEERARDGAKAMMEYEAEGRAVRAKTERLRALRLAKEAAEQSVLVKKKGASK